MDLLHFINPGHLDCFYFLATGNIAMNIGRQIFLEAGKYLEVQSLATPVYSVLITAILVCVKWYLTVVLIEFFSY